MINYKKFPIGGGFTCLHSLATGHVVRVVEVRDPCLGTVSHANLHLVGTPQLRELLLHVIYHLDRTG